MSFVKQTEPTSTGLYHFYLCIVCIPSSITNLGSLLKRMAEKTSSRDSTQLPDEGSMKILPLFTRGAPYCPEVNSCGTYALNAFHAKIVSHCEKDG